jgi:aconitate hydratase
MLDSFRSLRELHISGKTYHYFDLDAAEQAGVNGAHRLPLSLKVLLENLLRHEDGNSVTRDDILAFSQWLNDRRSDREIAYRPARVLMQDFTGVPAIVDLAAMRDAMKNLQGDPNKINPLCPVDLVIDHSVQVDKFGNAQALHENTELEMTRNHERYTFLKWGQSSFSNFQAVPPGTGICHQVNLEYLSQVAFTQTRDDRTYTFPDTLVGTDSHTTMVNGLGVLGWGVGGIEAEAAMLGQPVSMVIPEVIGFRLTGRLREGITATDLVLTITQMLRKKGVVGKFVEFYGEGLGDLPVADRATIANMAPEYGATCGFFPIDHETLNYLTLTGRSEETIARTEAYAKAQGLWRDEHSPEPVFTDSLHLDLGSVEASLAGPKRPQDRVNLSDIKSVMEQTIIDFGPQHNLEQSFATSRGDHLHHGDVVIAAITSCTNTSNPSVMLAAGLVAKKAQARGLTRKPWVKTSLAPGSKVVTDYLKATNLLDALNHAGFYLVGYGCTTCIGNSGPLAQDVADTISKNDLVVASVLSGNRNFEGRIHPQVKTNWLASPPLVVAFAIAGTTRIDFANDPLGHDQHGKPVYLKDLWPTNAEIAAEMQKVTQSLFSKEYAEVFLGDKPWQDIKIAASDTFTWDADSTYVRNPPYFANMQATPAPVQDIQNARLLAILGDSVTTDHISPAGSIKADSPAGKYLKAHGVAVDDFNSYGSRRGNHEVMVRGTFANIRIRNEMVPGTEGGITKHYPSGDILPIYDAAERYQASHTPLIVMAGKEYGTGSSRDWAAKGTLLLGVKAVIAESFERIHRSNLIGMGVLPLVFTQNMDRRRLNLNGDEVLHIDGLSDLTPGANINLVIERADGRRETVSLRCAIDTMDELSYYKHGGILPYVLRNMIS